MNGKVCASCNIELYPRKNGVFVLEYAGDTPYKIWNADLWGCKNCGAEIVLGFPPEPIAEHFQTHFMKVLAEIKERGATLIDCFEKIQKGAPQ